MTLIMTGVLLVYVALSALSRCGRLPQVLTYYIKASQLALLVPLSSVIGLLTSIILVGTSLRNSIPFYTGRIFSSLAKPILDVRIDMHGLEHLQNRSDSSITGGLDGSVFQAVFVANHQASLDLLIMSSIFPKCCTTMAKHSLKYVPFLGLYMVAVNTIFIDRANHAKTLVTMAAAAQRLVTEKLSVFVYPEGTRSRTRNRSMLPFKKGAFHLAVQAQIPIVPVVFSAYDHIYDSQLRRFKGVLPPISTLGMNKEDVERLTSTTRDLMIATLQEISPPRKDN